MDLPIGGAVTKCEVFDRTGLLNINKHTYITPYWIHLKREAHKLSMHTYVHTYFSLVHVSRQVRQPCAQP